MIATINRSFPGTSLLDVLNMDWDDMISFLELLGAEAREGEG